MQSVRKETKDLVLEVFEIRGEHNSVSRFVARAEIFTRTCMDSWDQTPSVHLHLPFSVHFMVIVKCAEVKMHTVQHVHVHVHIQTQNVCLTIQRKFLDLAGWQFYLQLEQSILCKCVYCWEESEKVTRLCFSFYFPCTTLIPMQT